MGVVAAFVGLVGGALVPLTAYRLAVPFDQPDRGACLHCGRPLPAGVAGWVRWPVRCHGCGARLGPPPAVTAAIGAVAAYLVAVSVKSPAWPLFVALAVLGVLLGAIDVVSKRLPHLLVLPAIVISTVGFLAVAAVTGNWTALVRYILASVVMAVVYGALYLLPGRAVGPGDITLGALLGGYLGWLGWPYVIWGALLPWLVNLPALVFLLLRRRLAPKSTVPFGPAMLIGAILAVLVGSWLDRTGAR